MVDFADSVVGRWAEVPPPALEPASEAPAVARLVGAGLAAVVGVLAGWLLWQSRTVEFQYLTDIAAMAAVVLAAGLSWLAWFGVLAVLGGTRRRWVCYRQPYRRALWAGCAVFVALIMLRVPFRVDVLLASSALGTEVRAVQAGGDRTTPHRVGRYAIDEAVLTDPDCRGARCEVALRFDVNSSGPSALVYAPAGEPAFPHSGNGGHLFGPWYWAADD